ncbi:hypothetical protein [Pseudomonas sp. RIT288]|uniref:hypothetical protein n=1 Tax=Pseudomonas sp. RIT288 TaxID=1470589 RepID=UPI00044B6870|nr:hypothetical protein [Pseudomonas sp. RIT288]EZP31278.1 hypothetical protein BW33_02512 [Pseudomonas sp. RIT288]
MDVLFFFIAWAGMWVWVVRNRSGWNLLLANLLGAASGLMVGLVVWQLYIGLFGSSSPPVLGFMRTVLEVLSLAAAVIGVWMLVAHRSQVEHPVLRQMLAGLCGTVAGITTIVFFVQIDPPTLGM